MSSTHNKKTVFPTLYKIDKLKRMSMWRIYVIGDSYFRESGIKGGKVKKYEPVKCEGKNIGKANETTSEQQAILEAESQWRHKKDELYTENELETENRGGVEDAKVGDGLRPMLAEKWTDYKKYAQFPGAVSPKLDGVRVMIYNDAQGDTVMISRGGKKYKFMNGIRDEAKKVINEFGGVVLDGELYSHDIPFNAISGSVRTQDKPSKYENDLKYYIFDIWDPKNPNLTYVQRMDKLRKICMLQDFKKLHFVFYEKVESESEIPLKHSEYVEKGYEGLMFRNLNSVYTLGRRVKDLLKYKEFVDDEFKVINVIEGNGSESGAAIFVCETNDGRVFNIRPRGSIEKRKEQYKNKNKYIGKMLTVRYQFDGEKDVLPRFPVGIGFRDYE